MMIVKIKRFGKKGLSKEWVSPPLPRNGKTTWNANKNAFLFSGSAD